MATIIQCDQCSMDLTESGPTPTFALHLKCWKVPNHSGGEHTILVTPPLEEDTHFCGIKCLHAWACTKMANSP